MKIFDALDREVFRPFVTLILPGAAGLVPYVFVLARQGPGIVDFAGTETTSAGLILFFAAAAIGLILEDLGSWLETRWDNRLKKSDSTHEEIWLKYLTLRYKTDEEPLGQHYLRTVLLRLKFELSFGIGLVFALPGVVWLGIDDALTRSGTFIVVALLLLVALYLLRESWDSVKTLAKHRSNLVQVDAEVAS